MDKIQPVKRVSLPEAPTSDVVRSRSRVEARRARIFWGLLAVVALAPLPLGAARPLAWEILGLAVALLLIAALSVNWDRDDYAHDLLVPGILFFLVLGYAVLQCMPVPDTWSNPIWDLASDGLQQKLRGTIAVNPELALVYVFRLLTYAGIFLVAFLLGRDRNRAQVAITLVTFASAIYAAYGLVDYWTGNGTILWMSKWAYGDDLTSTFVNRNSFATYAGLGLLACLTDLIGALEGMRIRGSRREQFAHIIEHAGSRSWQLVSLFVLATALLLTHSRGGLLATLLGAVMLLLAIWAAPSMKGFRFLVWGAIPLILILAALVINGDQTLDRLMEIDVDTEGRTQIFSATWQAVRDFFLLGTGLGSFASVFQIYRPETIQGVVDLAHDDYLQNMLELGVPAALCLFATILWLVGLCLRGIWWRNRDVIFPALGFVATVLVASHALVDFSLQIPAVTATYMLLLGVAVAQSRSSVGG